jgi:FMN-dependent NADH-azoreductase
MFLVRGAVSGSVFVKEPSDQMMQILHVSCSPRGQVSESYRISRKIIEWLRKRDPTAILVNRTIGGGAMPHIDESYATIQELESSDYVVIGTPMHNFTVPSALKAWIDHIVRVRRTFNTSKEGYVGVLRDRPVFVAVSSGGRYSRERARQPDFLTPYLKTVLGVIGLHDVTFFSVEGSSLGLDGLAARIFFVM